ncbi:MAG: PilZ domain-containing protein [bacterium]|nr:PilZ domain-containing protein [bacterium]
MLERSRLNPRLEIELPAEYRVEASDKPRLGTIANLSAGGAALLTDRQIPPRALLHQFRFSLPGDKGPEDSLEASAVLVHARPYKTDVGTIGYCSGLHFLGFESRAFERLENFVLDRLELAKRQAR